jgi:hypothetical protein
MQLQDAMSDRALNRADLGAITLSGLAERVRVRSPGKGFASAERVAEPGGVEAMGTGGVLVRAVAKSSLHLLSLYPGACTPVPFNSRFFSLRLSLADLLLGHRGRGSERGSTQATTWYQGRGWVSHVELLRGAWDTAAWRGRR